MNDKAKIDALRAALNEILTQHGQWNNGMWAANIATKALSLTADASEPCPQGCPKESPYGPVECTTCVADASEQAPTAFLRQGANGMWLEVADTALVSLPDGTPLYAHTTPVPDRLHRILEERIDQAHSLFLEGMQSIGLGDGTKGWIEHADGDEPLRRDEFSLAGEILFGFEEISALIAELRTNPASPPTADSAADARDAVVDAAEGLLEVLDAYPEQLVPINRKSITCNTLRAALASMQPTTGKGT